MVGIFDKTRSLLQTITLRWYELFFQDAIKTNAKRLLKNISYVALFTALGGMALFAYNIILVRTLGAAEFGKYSLVVSISQFLYVPMLFGLNHAATRYVAGFPDDGPVIIGTVIRSVVLFCLLSAALTVVLVTPLSALLHVNPNFIYVSLVFAVFSALFIVVKAIFFAQHSFKKFSIIETASSYTSLLIGLLLLLVLKQYAYVTPVYVYVIATSLLLIVSYGFLRNKIGSFDTKWLKRLVHYGAYTTIGGISAFLLTSSDKLVIHNYFEPRLLGIYSAYFIASSSVILGKGLAIVNSVFFPTIAGLEDKEKVCRLINQASVKIILSMFAGAMILVFVLIQLYGRQYPYDFVLAVLFSLNASFFFIHQIYTTLLSSHNIQQLKMLIAGFTFFAVLNLVLNVSLTPIYGIYMAASILMLSNFCIFLFMRIYATKVFTNAKAL